MKLPEMKTGLTVSALIHAALLLWGLISFSAKPLEAAPKDAMPVDIISAEKFSELSKGVKNAKKTDEAPKPLVEKIDTPKPVDDSSAKVSPKPEIQTAASAPPPPPPTPEPKQPEAKPDKKPPPKVDPIAETLKKEEAKKRAEEKAKEKSAQQQKPAPPQPKFDPNQIAALLDKRDPQRLAATGEVIAPAPPMGVAAGNSAKLSQSELDAMRARLMQLWNPPAGVQNPQELVVKVRIKLNLDGRLNGPPVVLTSGRGSIYEIARDNAIRALFRGQPFDMLSKSTYELWKEIEITFDPRDMYRG